jgi:hypothetical protein
MPVSFEQFSRDLEASGLVPAEEISVLRATLLAEKHSPDDAQSFARELVRQRKLTAYQATVLYQGKSQGLHLGNYELLDQLGHGGMASCSRPGIVT